MTSIQERFATALERLDGDVELLCEMAAITAADLPVVTQDAKSLLDDGDVNEAARSLHKLKGMLSTFDSDGVVLHIQEMLESARTGKLEEVRTEFCQKKPSIDSLIQEIVALAQHAS